MDAMGDEPADEPAMDAMDDEGADEPVMEDELVETIVKRVAERLQLK